MQDKLSDVDSKGIPKQVVSEFQQTNELYIHKKKKEEELRESLKDFDEEFEKILYQIQNKDNDIKKNRAQHKEEIVYLKDKLKRTEQDLSRWSSQCLTTEDNNNKLIASKDKEMKILEKKLNNPTSETGVDSSVF